MEIVKQKGDYKLLFEDKAEFEFFNTSILQSIGVMSHPMLIDQEPTLGIAPSSPINNFTEYLLAVSDFN